MKLPARSKNAVFEPRGIAPSPRLNMPMKIIDWMGQLSSWLTWLKNLAHGVMLSLANAHHMRDNSRNVPMRQIRRDRKMISSSPKVAPLLPVAWE
jgi:hypothetical protein